MEPVGEAEPKSVGEIVAEALDPAVQPVYDSSLVIQVDQHGKEHEVQEPSRKSVNR